MSWQAEFIAGCLLDGIVPAEDVPHVASYLGCLGIIRPAGGDVAPAFFPWDEQKPCSVCGVVVRESFLIRTRVTYGWVSELCSDCVSLLTRCEQCGHLPARHDGMGCHDCGDCDTLRVSRDEIRILLGVAGEF